MGVFGRDIEDLMPLSGTTMLSSSINSYQIMSRSGHFYLYLGTDANGETSYRTWNVMNSGWQIFITVEYLPYVVFGRSNSGLKVIFHVEDTAKK